MVHPHMKVKDAELPFRILSMMDASSTLLPQVLDSLTLLLVNLSVALSPVIKTMGMKMIITTMKRFLSGE